MRTTLLQLDKTSLFLGTFDCYGARYDQKRGATRQTFYLVNLHLLRGDACAEICAITSGSMSCGVSKNFVVATWCVSERRRDATTSQRTTRHGCQASRGIPTSD